MTEACMEAPGCAFARGEDARTVPLTALRDDECTRWRVSQWATRTVDSWQKSVSRQDLEMIRRATPENIRTECFKKDASQEVFDRLAREQVDKNTALLAVLDDDSLKRLERVL